MNDNAVSTDPQRDAATDANAVRATEMVSEEAEPWEPWETRLCLWSLVIGVGGLVVLGVLVNLTLLAGT